VEAASAEPGRLCEPEAIKLDNGGGKSSDKDVYAAFEAIGVEDKEAFI